MDVFSLRKPIKTPLRVGGVILLQLLCLAQAQSVVILPTEVSAIASPPSAAVSVPVVNTTPASGLQWNDLPAQKQQSLAPLQRSWPLLSEAHQRKWLTLARNFPNMTPAEQAKLHSRMVEWAALKPNERELARLNFAETKKLPPEERAANWEAYQALSEDDRKKLAARAMSKKAKGGALAVKPTHNNKFMAVPVTRYAPESLRALMHTQPPISPHTLLPMRPVSAAPLQEP